ncbi:unnamed protein product [Phytophthora fragariaefolia]|uniref:Unnamed protein product n=1 Tax=Phytophthora fragariaefolia TaxID=1490495 RepID=A0A9W6WMA4_9STRA|nr:unnamed protein product [Phytophthora fragariaefolia]
MLRDEQAAQAVNSIFGNIRASEVHQQTGRTYYNAGEILPSGVSRILTAIGLLDEADVFLDVGAGVGNIIAHVALTTDARRCVGIEVRSDLVSLGQRCKVGSITRTQGNAGGTDYYINIDILSETSPLMFGAILQAVDTKQADTSALQLEVISSSRLHLP